MHHIPYHCRLTNCKLSNTSLWPSAIHDLIISASLFALVERHSSSTASYFISVDILTLLHYDIYVRVQGLKYINLDLNMDAAMPVNIFINSNLFKLMSIEIVLLRMFYVVIYL